MARGYNAFADVLRTRDGVDVNDLYREAFRAVNLRNEQRQRWVDLLTYRTTAPSDTVIQSGDTDIRMEPSSEYGLPTGIRTDETFLTMGARAQWYDIGAKFTYRALADMTSSQVEAVTNAALEADNKLTYELTLTQLFNPANVTFADGGVQMTAFTFWNGDGTNPPSYNGNVFSGGTHTHFRVSGAAAVTSGDLDEIIADFKSHGFSRETGSQMVLLVNTAEADVINTFRTASGAKEDFIASTASPGFYSPTPLIGDRPAGTFAGFPVRGSYGELLIIEDTRIPAGYIVGLVSGGENVGSNPIMLREHPSLTGLQIIPGPNTDYPLIESYFAHYVGTGVRQRGAGLVMQIKASGSYEAPATFAI